MKRIRITRLFALAAILSLSACMPEKYNSYIVGKWHPSQLRLSDIQQYSFVPDTGGDQISEENRQVLDQLKQELLKQKGEGTTFKDMQSQMRNAIAESQVKYTFRSNGEGSRMAPGEDSFDGTWQLKKRGKMLVLTSPDKIEPFKLILDSLSAKKMVVYSPNMPRGMKLTYTKQ